MTKIQLTNDNTIIELIEFINNGNKINDKDIILPFILSPLLHIQLIVFNL